MEFSGRRALLPRMRWPSRTPLGIVTSKRFVWSTLPRPPHSGQTPENPLALAQKLKDALDAELKALAGRRQREALAGAIEKRLAQPGLQFSNALRCRRLGQIYGNRRPAEPQMPACGQEGGQMADIGNLLHEVL